MNRNDELEGALPAPAPTAPPRHVAFIMDGNGRWAHRRSLPRSEGHRQGVEAVRRTIRAAVELGVRYVTLFAFSTENWARPTEEVNFLFVLLRRFIRQDVAELHAAGVRIRVIGERRGLAPDIVALIDDCERLTAANTVLDLVVAFNYGSRQEIAQAVRRIAVEVAAGRLDPDAITAETVSRNLYAPDVPEPDLLIRTSGEHRISNYLLWQMAYTEFVFVDELWPDFGRDSLVRAIETFRRRDRRFGGLSVHAAQA